MGLRVRGYCFWESHNSVFRNSGSPKRNIVRGVYCRVEITALGLGTKTGIVDSYSFRVQGLGCPKWAYDVDKTPPRLFHILLPSVLLGEVTLP